MSSKTDKMQWWWLAPSLASAGVLLLLFGIFPYGMGYGNVTQPVWKGLSWMWFHAENWEHCVFVPFICAGLVWWNREKFEGLPVTGDTKKGGAILFVAMLWYWMGYKIDIAAFSFLCIQLTIGGLIVWFLGWRWFLALLFPWAFLVFAWPFTFLETVAFKLRIVMSEMSAVFLNLIGIACIKSGTAIRSAPDYARGIPMGAKFELDVADPCSGIRSLFALTMISALYAHLMLRKVWQQWVLFLCSAPLAILGNFGRIIMLTFGTLLFGPQVAIGTHAEPSLYHMASGFFVFFVALGGMALVGWLLDGGALLCRRRLDDLWASLMQPEASREAGTEKD